VVVPDAVLLSEADCFSLQAAVLSHCGFKMKNRFAILDVYNGTSERTFDDEDVINKFREGVGSNFLMWGASYYPFLNTTLIKASEIDYTRVDNLDGLIEVLTKEVADNLAAENITEARAEGINGEINKISEDNDVDAINSLHATLTVISPKLNMIITEMSEMLNLMPPSSAMAGAYSMVDFTASVAQSPANISLGSVVSPAVNINNDNQEDLNLPLNGKAVNAIRSFQGKGVLVWGARTLDGNSKDYRYVSVRRTMTFLEQSIKFAAEAFVFAPNNATTWSTLRATVSNFLTNQWQSGLLAGQSPDDAFEVEIGLGATMTPNDILDGILKMTIKVAITRPAEFIVITFEQQQQKS
jgi:phage tail sheath protein FI